MFPSSGQERDIINLFHQSNHALVSAPQNEGQRFHYSHCHDNTHLPVYTVSHLTRLCA
jgi:hypothetical protein